MKIARWPAVLLMAICVLAVAGVSLAVTDPEVKRGVFGSAGEVATDGNLYVLNGTLGEPIASSLVQESNLGLSSGYWWPQTAIVVDPPGPFGKSTPANAATGVPLSPTLTWSSSNGASSYEYCYDSTNDNACSNWTSNGTNTSASLGGLSAGTPYFWHVRAQNISGTTYSDGTSTAFWSFTTATNPPGPFGKSAPANGTTDVAIGLTLTWGSSSGATGYEYCYDTTNDSACSNWTPNGASTSAPLGGLSANTLYYWHVRAQNNGDTTYSDGNSTAFWSFTTASNPSVLLPIVLESATFCYEGAFEIEDNDLAADPNGPLCPPKTVSGFPDDMWDIFTYQHPSAGQMTIALTNHTGIGAQLLLYSGVPSQATFIDFDPGAPYQLGHNGPAGRYYIVIFTESGFNSTTSYDLTVTSP